MYVMFMNCTQTQLITGARRGRFMSNAEFVNLHISAGVRSAFGEKVSDWLDHLYSSSLGCSDGTSYKYCSMDTACAVIDQLSALQVPCNLPQVDLLSRVFFFFFFSIYHFGQFVSH